MTRRTKTNESVANNKKYSFFLTNAFGKNKEHFGLEISSDKKSWTFLTLTHTPSGHYRLLKDPATGKDNPKSSFLSTSPKTRPISTRLRLDKTRVLSKEDENNLDKLIAKKKSLNKAFNGTLHSSNRQIRPSFGQKGSDTRKKIKTKKEINVNKFGGLYARKSKKKQ